MRVSWFACVCSVVLVVVLSSAKEDRQENGPLQIPFVESRLCAISINSDRNLQLELVQVSPKYTINIDLSLSKYGNESQIDAKGMGDNVTIVTRDKLDLSVFQRQYITVFRKDNVLAVYRAGQVKPFLVYVYKGKHKIDFGEFEVMMHRGPRGRSFIGIPSISGSGVRHKAMAKPHGKVISRELNAIKMETNKRLAIMDDFMKKVKIHKLSLDNLKTVQGILDHPVAQPLTVLDYYGIKVSDKYKTLSKELFVKIRPKIKARIRKLSR